METNLMTLEDALGQVPYRSAVGALLFQLADDDLLIGFRDTEWLGLAPHIEEDVAFGSVSQEELGHATYYYHLLEDLGFGRADDLSALRPAQDRRNAVLLEMPNGPGVFLDDPHYNWAFTVARHYLYDVYAMVRLGDLLESSYQPLRDVAIKVLREKRYHRTHHELWVKTMASHSDDARKALAYAMTEAYQATGDLAHDGGHRESFEVFSIWPRVGTVGQRWHEEVKAFLEPLGVYPSGVAHSLAINGRNGEHTEHLVSALQILSEVYRLDPTAQW